MFLFKIIIAIILTEAITELVVKSEIFYPIRKFFFEHKDNKIYDWLYLLTDCGYCFSVWAGWFVALVFIYPFEEIKIISFKIDWFFLGLLLHRLSNVFHYLVDCFRKWLDNGQGN